MTTLNKETCPCCGQTVNTRQIAMFKGLVEALWKVYLWSIENKKHEFTRKDIKHLFVGSENITARFGDWIMFGGLVYRPEGDEKKGHYGLNLERCDLFFKGDYTIPTLIIKEVDGTLVPREYKTVREIPKVGQLCDDYGRYIVRYGQPQVYPTLF